MKSDYQELNVPMHCDVLDDLIFLLTVLVITAAGSNGMTQRSNSSGSAYSTRHEPPCTSMGITDWDIQYIRHKVIQQQGLKTRFSPHSFTLLCSKNCITMLCAFLFLIMRTCWQRMAVSVPTIKCNSWSISACNTCICEILEIVNRRPNQN